MPPLEIRTVDSFEALAREWHAATLADDGVTLAEARDRGLLNEQETRQLWQLLGLIDEDELVIRLPAWLADEKVGFTDGATPTRFVGRIGDETAKAIRFTDSVAARPLLSLAHSIRALEDGLSSTDIDDDRREWLTRRLQQKRSDFETRDGMTGLREEWLPKSQIEVAVRRRRSTERMA